MPTTSNESPHSLIDPIASPPLPPANAAEIEITFKRLNEARTQWQSRKNPSPLPPRSVIIAGRIALWLTVMLFVAFVVSLGFGNEPTTSLLLLAVAITLLATILTQAYGTYLDYQRMSKGNDDFEASVRHTLEINALALELSQSTLLALRVVYRSRKRVFTAIGTQLAFFAPPSWSAVVTQTTSLVAIVAAVTALIAGKDTALVNIKSDGLYPYILGAFVLGGFVVGTIIVLSALNESRPWVRKELVALEDAIVNLEQKSSDQPLNALPPPQVQAAATAQARGNDHLAAAREVQEMPR